MKAKLIVIGGTAAASEMDLDLPTVIGRGRSADVTIPHSLVSRQHCEISERDGYLVVRDLGSMNGTYVGDERISEIVLEPDALLTVGTVTFRAIYEVGNSDPPADRKSAPQFAGNIPAGERARADAETVPVDSHANGDLPHASGPPAPHRAPAKQGTEPDTSHMIDVGGPEL